MLFQEVGHSLTYGLLYSTINLAVTQLSLGLTFELRLGNLYRDNGCKTLAEVILCHLNLGFLNLLTQLIVFVGILLQCTSQSDTETSKVGTTFDGIDIVNV